MLKLVAVIVIAGVGVVLAGHYWPWVQPFIIKHADFFQGLDALRNLIVGVLISLGIIWGWIWNSKQRKDPPGTTIINLETYITRPERENQRLYLANLAQRCETISLSVLDKDEDNATSPYKPLALDRIYVDLDTEAFGYANSVEIALIEGSRLVTRPTDKAEDLKRLTALEAVAIHPRLVLLGAPGSGKTTFVNRLCLALARDDWKDLPSWPQRLRQQVPILVILRDFARWLDAQAEPPEAGVKLLWTYILHDLDNRNLADAAVWLQDKFDHGEALLCFDGLDEIPQGWGQTVVESLQAYTGPCPVVVTCRVASYERPAWRLAGDRFQAIKLAAFDDAKIRRFIDAWYEEMANRWNKPVAEMRELAAKLTDALHRSDMARLASNPLLLTVMVLVHTHDKVLPDHRAELYERCVVLLLSRWERRRQKAGEEPELLTRLREEGSSETDLLRELRRLAFEIHGKGGLDDKTGEAAGIPKLALVEALSCLHSTHSLDWAQELVELMSRRTGLLVEREPGVFAFPHRTFQEYLAGVHLSLQPNFITRSAALVDSDAYWREVILLAVGYKVYVVGDYDLIMGLVDEFCPDELPTDNNGWRKQRLAGEIVLEMGVSRCERVRKGGERVTRVRERLTLLVEQGRLSPEERAQVGELLGTLGDPRFDPDCFHLPCRFQGQPEPMYGFVEIPAGPFWMGSEPGDKDARDNEFGNANPVDMPKAYSIARYPVTVAQYDAFVRDGGYTEEDWWTTKEARAWLHESERAMPKDWDTQRLHPNRPVVSVTWYEAMAYCAWLDDRLRQRDPALMADGYIIRLPTEAEWEKAARHTGNPQDQPTARRYPWGEADWNPQLANINQSKLGHASPVGSYPLGATPTGLYDLAGNVWEWMHTAYAKYPYDPVRDPPDAGAGRVLRGGSWFNDARYCRSAFRDGNDPDGRVNYSGFRCARVQVVSQASKAGQGEADAAGEPVC